MEFRPLYMPLEFRVTAGRVCRSLGFCLEKNELKVIKKKIRNLYKELTDQKPETIKTDKYLCVVYPVEFIPVMVNMVKEYKKELDALNLK